MNPFEEINIRAGVSIEILKAYKPSHFLVEKVNDTIAFRTLMTDKDLKALIELEPVPFWTACIIIMNGLDTFTQPTCKGAKFHLPLKENSVEYIY